MKKGIWHSKKVSELCKNEDFNIALGMEFAKIITEKSVQGDELKEASIRKEEYKLNFKMLDHELTLLADFKNRSMGIVLVDENVEALWQKRNQC